MEFILLPWEERDILSTARYGNNEKIANNLRNAYPFPYTVKDAEDYIKSCIETDGQKRILRAIEINGEACGSIGVFLQGDVYEKSAELGYWLGEPYWGRGIMTRAIREICGEAFARFDLARIYAEPFAHNLGSRRALEKAGFSLEGVLKKSVYKNGGLFASCMYALVR